MIGSSTLDQKYPHYEQFSPPSNVVHKNKESILKKAFVQEAPKTKQFSL